MIPALPVSLVGVIWFIYVVRDDQAKSTLIRHLPFFIIGVGLFAGAYSTFNLMTTLSDSRALRSEEFRKISGVLEMYPDALVICSYRCGMPQAAISFGVGYTDGKLEQNARPFLNNYTDVRHAIYQPNQDYSADKINELIQNGKKVMLLSLNKGDWLQYFDKNPILFLSKTTLYRINKISPPNPKL